MPVFFEKEQYILIQLESDADWLSFYDGCEGYITPQAYQLIHDYLNQSAKTMVIEKGYVDADYRDTYFNFFSPQVCSVSKQNNPGEFLYG